MKLIQDTLKISLLSSAIVMLAGCESTSTKSSEVSPANALGDSAPEPKAVETTDVLIPAVVDTSAPVVKEPEPAVVEKPKPVVIVEKPKPVAVVEKPKPVVEASRPDKVKRIKLKLTKYVQGRLDEMDEVCKLSNTQYNAIAKLFDARTKELRKVPNREDRLVINQKYYQYFMSHLTTEQRIAYQSRK